MSRGRRVTCSRCSWATRRRGRWRKQSRALVKATVTAAPPAPGPARRSLPHISPKHYSGTAHPGAASDPYPGRPRTSEPEKIDRLLPLRLHPASPAVRLTTRLKRAGQGRFCQSLNLSAEPLGGSTSFTKFSFPGNDGRRCRFSSQSWPCLDSSRSLIG